MKKETLNYFSNLIKERFEQNPENGKHCTEDTVRYLFMSSLILNEGVSPNEITLECPYFEEQKNDDNKSNDMESKHKKRNIELDMMVETSEKTDVIELKYFRSIPSGKNVDRTGLAARLVFDMKRVLMFENFNNKGNTKQINRYVILVSRKEMNNYLSNEGNGFKCIFSNEEGESCLSLQLSNNSKHYKEMVYDKFNSIFEDNKLEKFTIQTFYKNEINDDLSIRVFKIEL